MSMDGHDEALGNADSQTDDEDDFHIKGAASHGKTSNSQQQEDAENCTICLQAISERAVAVPCNHLTFDFICLVSWLQERSACPLCNLAVTAVQYDWRSPEDFKTYHVPEVTNECVNESAYQRSRRRRGQDFVRRRAAIRTSRAEQSVAAGADPALERRRRVYRDQLFSLHVGANRVSQYQDFTPQDFAANPALQSRARMFLRRELQVFSFLDTAAAPRGGNREFLLEYIVAVLRTNEPKGASGHAEDLLAEYLGRKNARLVLHELEAWLRSPYPALDAWDRHVQYAGEVERAGGKSEVG